MTSDAAPTGKRGRQPDDSAAAIQTCLTIKVLFGMPHRQIEPSTPSVARQGSLLNDFPALGTPISEAKG